MKLKNQNFLITQDNKNKLEKKLKILIQIVRPQVIKDLQQARAQGDLSENADYDAARNKQAEVEKEIEELESYLKQAVIITHEQDKKLKNVVDLGTTVKVRNVKTKEELVLTILGIFEIDPLKNIISVNSPVAKALWGHKVGDTVVVNNIMNPYMLEILAVE